ncbi:XerC Integrase [uncultured Caudovirales phage]|uniref:Integrase n=1 Tax=uncultured Caudovirales phage TaxID=2100421 RepID=A0A6J5R3Q3_9CAUD|nr:XerC Integrase [uncultured Caudovirales phage]CAB4185176.1 XerC Integrase [uncultured Caudovirales phage]CAB4188191.1 XerC Integrase [uncultured Caudovirales phage]CAB4191447.1 XerC Integrase [uncultured Caudovirales phage]CAB5229676.1 XerC Integrase [uncultured Caudovirales phage]
MASIDKRTSASGTAYRVRYRIGSRDRALSFSTIDDAIAYQQLVERLGGADAERVQEARERPAASRVTVAECVLAHIDAKRNVTTGTRRGYHSILANHIDDTRLGSLPISAVIDADIDEWWDDQLAKGLSANTRSNQLVLLRAVFKTAIKDRTIASDPTSEIRVGRDGIREPMTFLSAGEFAVLLSEIPADYQALIIFLVGTGARWGEASALPVGNVDLDAEIPVVRITQAWKRTGKTERELGPPKSRAGIRTISLPPEVVDTFRHLVDERASDEFVFTNPKTGRYLYHDRFYAGVWAKAIKRLHATVDNQGQPCRPKLAKKVRIHDLRHTHASLQIAAGVNLLDLKVRLGHEKITTTVDTYGHLAPQALSIGAAAASAFLTQAVPRLELEA